MELNSNVPPGPLDRKWSDHKLHMKLVNPANKRKYSVIVVGSGLAGSSATATLAELGYKVACFCYQDSPRRAHSIAAQGGINAAKNYQNDGDSVHRLFYRHCERRRLPLPRGQRPPPGRSLRRHHRSMRLARRPLRPRIRRDLLTNRSFGGAQVSRTFYARGQTGQQLLLGAYQALERQIGLGTVTMYRPPRDAGTGRRRRQGQAASSPETSKPARLESHAADAVLLATGGYGTVFYLATYAKGCNTSAIWRAYKKGARRSATPATPRSIRLASRLRVNIRASSLSCPSRFVTTAGSGSPRSQRRPPDLPTRSPRTSETTYLERKYPSFGNLAPRDISSRARPRKSATRAEESARRAWASISTSPTPIRQARRGQDSRALWQPFRHVRTHHRREPVQGSDAYLPRDPLHHGRALGRLQPHEHHPRPLRAAARPTSPTTAPTAWAPRALMQGLADGYFVMPLTPSATTSASNKLDKITADHSAFRASRGRWVKDRTRDRFLGIKGQAHGRHLPPRARQDPLGVLRHGPKRGRASKRPCEKIPALRAGILGPDVSRSRRRTPRSISRSKKQAESPTSSSSASSCAWTPSSAASPAAAHFREEFQTEEGEALRERRTIICHVAAWEYAGEGANARSATSSPSSSKTSTSRLAATSNRSAPSPRSPRAP